MISAILEICLKPRICMMAMNKQLLGPGEAEKKWYLVKSSIIGEKDLKNSFMVRRCRNFAFHRISQHSKVSDFYTSLACTAVPSSAGPFNRHAVPPPKFTHVHVHACR